MSRASDHDPTSNVFAFRPRQDGRRSVDFLPPGIELLPEALRSPILRKGLAYWQRIAGGRRMPARKDLDPLDIPELLPHIMLKDVQREPLDFRYRLVGSMVRLHSSADYTGECMSRIPHQGPDSVVWKSCAWVAGHAAPLLLRPPYAGPQQDFLAVEAAILPLGETANSVDKLLVFLDFIKKSAEPD
ncbi:MAG: PAS domain-containing protein [Alphaproteobacteria bacterium]|nr:PAS domain-containing protein [Alphaproteobacteria bacterium]